MIPDHHGYQDHHRRFPRVSGDDPAVALMAAHLVQFSPRERG